MYIISTATRERKFR